MTSPSSTFHEPKKVPLIKKLLILLITQTLLRISTKNLLSTFTIINHSKVNQDRKESMHWEKKNSQQTLSDINIHISIALCREIMMKKARDCVLLASILGST